MYKQVKRTEGVSTTDIVGRMLLMTKEHHLPAATAGTGSGEEAAGNAHSARDRAPSLRSSSLAARAAADDQHDDNNSEDTPRSSSDLLAGGSASSRITQALSHFPSAGSRFLPTARRIMQFADGKVPRPEDKVSS